MPIEINELEVSGPAPEAPPAPGNTTGSAAAEADRLSAQRQLEGQLTGLRLQAARLLAD
jgi:hypothetical protein